MLKWLVAVAQEVHIISAKHMSDRVIRMKAMLAHSVMQYAD